jgi:hypothetical protein
MFNFGFRHGYLWVFYSYITTASLQGTKQPLRDRWLSDMGKYGYPFKLVILSASETITEKGDELCFSDMGKYGYPFKLVIADASEAITEKGLKLCFTDMGKYGYSRHRVIARYEATSARRFSKRHG